MHVKPILGVIIKFQNRAKLIDKQQAKAAGEAFSTTPFSYITTSPLLRAYDTAKAIQLAQPELTRPELVSSPLLKEQNFGIAEGNRWTMERQRGLSDAEHWARGIYPVLDGRKAMFPEGESLDDLRDRAILGVKELIVPTIRDVVKEKKEDVHVALVSHGLCICEMVAALLALDYEMKSKGQKVPDRQYAGLLNTAWTRATIDLAVRPLCHHLTTNNQRDSIHDIGETAVDENGLPALSIKVTDVNRHEHLDGLVCFKPSLPVSQGLTEVRTLPHRNVRRALVAKPMTRLRATFASSLGEVLSMAKRLLSRKVEL